MVKTFQSMTVVGFVLAGSLATTAAPGQGQDRPGIISQPRVFVENRREEAVPVSVVRHPSDAPERVTIVGTPVVALSATSPMRAMLVPQVWEYRSLVVPESQDPTTTLSALGQEGWEAATQSAANGRLTIILKRPRAN